MSGRAAGAGRAARNGVGECAQRPLVGPRAVSPCSRRYVCDVSRANQSVPGIRAARSRVARIVLRTCVPRGAMHSDVHLTLLRSRGAKQASLRVRHLKLSHLCQDIEIIFLRFGAKAFSLKYRRYLGCVGRDSASGEVSENLVFQFGARRRRARSRHRHRLLDSRRRS